MTDKLPDFAAWIGVWYGRGEAADGNTIHARCAFEPGPSEGTLRLDFEVVESEINLLLHAMRAHIGPGPGGVRGVGYSTLHGALVFEQTPDDAGVLALAGASPAGVQFNMTFVQETTDHLLFTEVARAPGDSNGGARMSAALERLIPRDAYALDDTARSTS